MWWRAPWLQQRWSLLGLALLDASLVVGNYNIFFWHRFDRWVGITGSVATVAAIWLASSYLLGRYSGPEDASKNTMLARGWASVITTGVVFAVVIAASWGLRSDDPRAFRSFVIPVLGATFLGSSLAQEGASCLSAPRKAWQLIAQAGEQRVIRQELAATPPAQALEIDFGLDTDINIRNTLKKVSRRQGFAISERANASDEVVEDLLSHKSQGVAICSLTTWCERYIQRIPPEILSARWLAQAEGFDLQPGRFNWRVKRFGDLFLSCALLLASAPLVALAALAITLEDRGPIFYSQIRSGLYGEPFRIWKLRSMRIDAESHGAQWSSKGDARITRVGYWLRQWRIDELPQLISVIKGEMSLIGPRPERPDIEKVLECEIPHYRVRHWIRPGLSGWAQVCYPYGASIEDSRAKLSYDLYYLRNASLALDVLILIKTIKLVLNRNGAIAKQASIQKLECSRGGR